MRRAMPEPSQLKGPELDAAMARHDMATRHAGRLLKREGLEPNPSPRVGCPICMGTKTEPEDVRACMDAHVRNQDTRLREWLASQYDTPEGDPAHTSYKREASDG